MHQRALRTERLDVLRVVHAYPTGIANMLALSLTPLHAGSAALRTIRGPEVEKGAVLAKTVAISQPKRSRTRMAATLISRRVPLAAWREAVTPRPDDVKVVIDFTLETD
jgi:hypothetical protein